MNNIQFPFLGLAIASAIFIMLIGIFIAEQSLIGVLIAIMALIATMAIGFISKKKLREK